jgi:lipid-A-disaccharide synthase
MSAILVVAGENSGEKYGARMVRQFKDVSPSYTFFGIGGNAMEKEGVHLVSRIEDLALVGFFEVISHLPRVKKIFRHIKTEAERIKPAAAVLIDSPDFNLRLAKALNKMSIPVLYYISPTVWAWRKRRLKSIKSTVDKMLLIFPFEEEIYRKHGIPAAYVGHPLKESIDISLAKEDFLNKYDLDPKKKLIAVLPGSRKSEIHFHMPVLIPSLKRIVEEFEVQIVLPLAENIGIDELQKHLPDPFPSLRILEEDKYEALTYSQIALSSCGTANLEAALLGIPLISFYRISPLTYFFGVKLIKIKSYSIVNILAGKRIVPELIQRQCNPANIFSETKKLLLSPPMREEMKAEFQSIQDLLGKESASRNAAQELKKLIGKEQNNSRIA